LPAIVAVLLGLVVAPLPALACRCREPPIGSAYRRASVVVLAEAIEVRGLPEIQGQEVKLRVIQTWKADARAIVTIVTGSDCAYSINRGETYLLFLVSAPPGGLTTGKCMGDVPEGMAKVSLAWLSRHGKRGVITAK
jgi:hypothetical protein